MVIDLLSWLACILSVLGTYLCGKKHISCWPIWVVASFVWMGIAFFTNQWALFTMFVLYQIFNIDSWKKWSLDK